MATATPTSAPVQPGDDAAKPAKGRRADYNQKLANDIAAALALIQGALDNADVLAALSYAEDELREGLALQAKAQKAFDARQTAQGAAGAKQAARDELLAAVLDDFKAFRTTVQSSLPTSARTPLGAGGVVPKDLQKLITLMRGAYETAKLPDFAPTLAKRKLTTAKLDARLAQVVKLEKLERDLKAADKGATAATQARDQAGDALSGKRSAGCLVGE